MLCLLWLIGTAAHAFNYDFEAGNLYYKILSEPDKTVAVTYPNEETPNTSSNPSEYSGITEVSIPNKVIYPYNNQEYTVTAIGDYAFYYCKLLTSVTLPNSITKIGQSAFNGCTGLTSVTLPNNITEIAAAAFAGCTGLTSVVIPNSVENISNSAFDSCTGLTSVIIGSSVNIIYSYAFNGCTSLAEIVSHATTAPKCLSDVFSKVPPTCTLYVPANGTGYDVAPWSSFTNIQKFSTNGESPIVYSFDDDAKTATVTNGKSCSGAIAIPDVVLNDGVWYTVTAIGKNAFEDCTALTEITIPDNVESLGQWAFRRCSNLKTVTIGSGVASIDYTRFYQCSSLETIVVTEDNPNYDSRNDCNAIISKENGTLVLGCRTTVIPDDISSIGENAFHGRGLQSATIPDDVTSIGESAFLDCTALTELTIGSGVTTIGNRALGGCSGLKTVTLRIEDPSQVTIESSGGTGLFGMSDERSDATLFVPKGTAEAYQASEWAKYFKTIKEYIAIDDENFPDENFRKYLLAQDYGKDGMLTDEEISSITEITVWNEGIKTLKGIEYFTALTYLYCENNALTTLDVSKNTALTTLMCSVNELTELDVTNNTALTTLSCYENQLTTLDLLANTALKTLDCSNNQIAGADMDALIESLPQTTDGKLNVYDATSESEGNVMTKVQVAAAKAKGWTPQYLLKNYTWSPYDGSTPESITVTVDGEVGLATFCSEYGVEFSEDMPIAAYKASVSGNTVTLTRVYTVAAEEGVLLKALDDYDGEAVELPTIEDGTAANDGNAFVGTLTDIVFEGNKTEDGETVYVLAMSGGKVGFFTNDNASKIEVGAHKAYLPVVKDDSADETRGLTLVFGDDTTSIVEIAPKASAADDAFYTLGGVRVKTPGRGLYIKNGKKVFIK